MLQWYNLVVSFTDLIARQVVEVVTFPKGSDTCNISFGQQSQGVMHNPLYELVYSEWLALLTGVSGVDANFASSQHAL